MTDAGSYGELVSLARRQQELLAEERFDELGPLQEEWARLAATLPDVPPAWARRELLEAQQAVGSARALLETALDSAGSQLAGVRRGRAALASYAPASRSLTVDAQG